MAGRDRRRASTETHRPLRCQRGDPPPGRRALPPDRRPTGPGHRARHLRTPLPPAREAPATPGPERGPRAPDPGPLRPGRLPRPPTCWKSSGCACGPHPSNPMHLKPERVAAPTSRPRSRIDRPATGDTRWPFHLAPRPPSTAAQPMRTDEMTSRRSCPSSRASTSMAFRSTRSTSGPTRALGDRLPRRPIPRLRPPPIYEPGSNARRSDSWSGLSARAPGHRAKQDCRSRCCRCERTPTPTGLPET